MTFQELVEIEPRLKDLLDEAIRLSKEPGGYWDKNHLWYGHVNSPSLKHRMAAIVGMYRKIGPAILQTSEAYDVCYTKLYRALCNKRN